MFSTFILYIVLRMRLVRFSLLVFLFSLCLSPIKLYSQTIKTDSLRNDSLFFGMQELGEVVVKGNYVVRSATGYKINISSVPVFKDMDGSQILSALPGMMIVGDKIQVKGNDVGKVYIDGRELHVPAEEIPQYFQSFRARDIKSVQVIENAGADENAEIGGTAVIKIITHHHEQGGQLSMSANSRLSENSKSLGTPSLVFQGRLGKWTLMSTLTPQKTWFHSSLLSEESYPEKILEKCRRQHSKTESLEPKVCVGYDFTPDDVLSISWEYGKWKREYDTRVGIETAGAQSYADMKDENGEQETQDYTLDYTHQWKGGSIGLYAMYSVRNESSDNLVYREGTPQLWKNENRFRQKDNMWQWKLKGQQQIWGEKASLTYGADLMKWKNENLSHNEQVVNGEPNPYFTHTADFLYKETLAAGYVLFDCRHQALSLHAGIRYEHRDISPGSAADSSYSVGTGKKKRFNDIFPDAKVKYVFDERHNHSIGLGYSRRLFKPTSTMVSPVRQWQDENHYTVGNPLMQPICSDKLTMDCSLWGSLSLTASYSKSPMFQSLYKKDEGRGVFYSTYDNGGKTETVSLALAYNRMLGIKGILNATCTYSHSRSTYNGIRITNSGFSASCFLSYSLGKGYSALMNASYHSSLEIPTFKSDPMGSASLSLSKSFMKSKLHVNAGYTYSVSPKTYITAGNVFIKNDPNLSPHSANITLSYSLSWGQRNLRVRLTGSDGSEERGRLK